MRTLVATALVFLGGTQIVSAADPCCLVTEVNAKSGIVTAKEKATGRTFSFTTNAAVVRSIRLGSPVYANFASKQVSVDGKSACCQIQSLTPPPSSPPGTSSPTTAAGARPAVSPQNLMLPDLTPYAFYNPATPPCPDPNFCKNSAQGCPSSAILEIPFGIWNAGPGTTSGTMTVELWTIPEFSGSPAMVGSWASSSQLRTSYWIAGRFHWSVPCNGAAQAWPTRPTYTLKVHLTGQNEARTDNNSLDLRIPPNPQIVHP